MPAHPRVADRPCFGKSPPSRPTSIQSQDKLEVRREKDRLTGREGDRYTDVGKGGLVRELVLSRELATALKDRRLAKPRLVIDRGVHNSQHYDIGGGRTWSQSFSSASKRKLGFSNGGPGGWSF